MALSNDELKLRLELIKKSIYGVYLQEGKKVSLFHSILNRVLILVKMPVCIALYENLGAEAVNEHRYKYLNKEFIVERNHSDIYHNIIKSKYNSGRYLFEEFHKDLVRIFNTKYLFLVFYIKFDYNDMTRKPVFTLVKSSNSEEISNHFDYIFKCFNLAFDGNVGVRKNSARSISNDFIDAVEYSIKKLNPLIAEVSDTMEFEQQDILTVFEDDYKIKLINNQDGVINNIFYKMRDVVNNLFSHSQNSNVTNMLFFSRHYTRNKLRYENSMHNGYDYNVGFIIPNHQRIEFIDFFKSLKIGNVESSRRFYESEFGELFSSVLDQDINSRDLKAVVDKEFWDVLMTKDGPIKIVNILHEALGDHARSFTDAVFANGIIHYRKPYEKTNKGLDRVHGYQKLLGVKSFDDIPENKRDDFFRVVVSYYLIQSMLKKEDEASQYLVTFPIEILGCIHTILIMTINSIDNAPYESGELNSWDYLYYYYNNVVLPIENDLKESLKEWYLNEIHDHTEKGIRAALAKAKFGGISQKHFNLYLEASNKKLRTLTRFVPYPEVTLMLFVKKEKITRKQYHNYKALSIDICDVFELYFSISKNNFFHPIYGNVKDYSKVINTKGKSWNYGIEEREIRNMANRLKDNIESFVADIYAIKG